MTDDRITLKLVQAYVLDVTAGGAKDEDQENSITDLPGERWCGGEVWSPPPSGCTSVLGLLHCDRRTTSHILLGYLTIQT